MKEIRWGTTIDYQYKAAGRRRVFFQGWYFKFSLDEETTLSLIPSLHKGKNEVLGSLQWILAQGDKVQAHAIHYPQDRISLGENPFRLKLGDTEFSEEGIRLREAGLSLTADFLAVRPYERNIMGPFRLFHPVMPCSHGLLATDGMARVSVATQSLTGVFDAGLYVEKDWGDTFPQRYIWIQADFPEANSSLFFSIASVEVGKLAFDGFIANLTLADQDVTFATWNLAQVRVRGNPQDIRVALGRPSMQLALRVLPGCSVSLESPRDGVMLDRIRESPAVELQLTLRRRGMEDQHLSTRRASVEYHDWFSQKATK